MNLRRILTSVAAAAFVVSGFAESVSRKDAQKFASDFFNEAFGRVMAKPRFVYNGKKLAFDRLFTPFYVFNNPAGGFVVIAADDKAFPILGYDLVDSFDPDRIGPEMKALLSGYSSEIEQIRLDSRVPEEAIKAWRYRPQYISFVLKAKPRVYGTVFSTDRAKEEIHALAGSYDAENYFSEVYSPSQWSAAVRQELDERKSVPIGFPAFNGFPVTVVYGTKGDYFRMALDGINNSFFRLNATEFITSPQIAMLGNPRIEEYIEPEEAPFAFHDAFIAEQEEARREAQRKRDMEYNLSKPQVRFIGGGHFDIVFPEEIIMARVYNLSGAQVATFKYKDTSLAHIDISAHPQGFYFLLANGMDGKPYGVKLVR